MVESLKYYEGFDRLKISVTDNSNSSFYSNGFILKTIFQNLIENALKYQNFSRIDPWLQIKIGRKDNIIQVTVEDNGVGVEESLHGKIFEMYFRGTETSKGSGLGLYLVKKAVEKLNGYIQFTSEPGKGTKFNIFLPQPRAVVREERISVA